MTAVPAPAVLDDEDESVPAGGPGYTSSTTASPLVAVCKPCDTISAEEICFVCGQPNTVLWRRGDPAPMDLP